MALFIIRDKTEKENSKGWPEFEDTKHKATTADNAHEKLKDLKEKGDVSPNAVVEMR